MLNCQYTDSRGGGTKFALAQEIEAANMNHDNYLVVTCTLHNLQTSLRNAVENVLGEGGVNADSEFKMNVMQMLHGAYNIQNWLEIDELKESWKYFTQSDDNDNVSTHKF